MNKFSESTAFETGALIFLGFKILLKHSGSKMKTQRLFRLIQTISEIIANHSFSPRHAGLDPASSAARSRIPGFPFSRKGNGERSSYDPIFSGFLHEERSLETGGKCQWQS